MKYYFYSRVSTVGQNTSRQTENFKNLGTVTSENLYVDKISGSVPFFERPQAKKLFERAIKLDPAAMDGSAYTSLGSLYYQVPGWPVGFGDDDKAKEMLLKGLDSIGLTLTYTAAIDAFEQQDKLQRSWLYQNVE